MSGAVQRRPLDGSAIVHLGSKNAHYTNTFRLTAVLTEPVDPLALQKAVDRINGASPYGCAFSV